MGSGAGGCLRQKPWLGRRNWRELISCHSPPTAAEEEGGAGSLAKIWAECHRRLDMQVAVEGLKAAGGGGAVVALHLGPVVAGLIGAGPPCYDIFGEGPAGAAALAAAAAAGAGGGVAGGEDHTTRFWPLAGRAVASERAAAELLAAGGESSAGLELR